MKIDWKKLKAAIAEDTQVIRALKAKGYRSLSAEKLEATRHHAIAAHLRGRIHLSGKFLCNPHWLDPMKYGPWFEKNGMSLEEQAKFIDRELKKFVIEEPSPEVVQETA